MKKRLYFCDQKKDCRKSSNCGVECFMTFVDYNEEFRDYLKQLADERGGIL